MHARTASRAGEETLKRHLWRRTHPTNAGIVPFPGSTCIRTRTLIRFGTFAARHVAEPL